MRLRKVRRVAAWLSQENGLDPLPEQIAEACNMNLDEVTNLLSIIEQPVSLDAPVDDEARYSLADTLEDTTTSVLTEAVSQHLSLLKKCDHYPQSLKALRLPSAGAICYTA